MITQENIPYTADEIKAMVKTCEKYNKVHDMAKNIYNSKFKLDEAAVLSKYLPMLFPELKESKDERIRRVIRGWIYSRPSEFFDNGISKEEMLDWVEKQGEQKDLIAEIKNRKALIGAEKEKAVSSTDKLSLGARIAMLDELLAWVKKQGQKEVTWNKEDEENMNNVLYILHQLKDTSSYEEDNIAEKTINWFDSLKDRLCSNNEYDKDMLGAIEYCKKNNRPLEKEHLAWLEKQGKTYRINNTPNCGISVNIYNDNEELKENKDERMKEQLSEYLHDNMHYKDAQEITSWLEKLIENQKD